MKNNVFKKLIASILAAGILVSSVGVLAAEDIEETSTAVSTTETTAAVDSTENVDNEAETKKGSDSESNDGLKVAHSTAAETGGVSDNGASAASTQVVWTGSNEYSSDVMGSENNPYAVSDVDHFLDMSRLINETTSGNKYFKLTANIDLTGVSISDIDEAASYGLANTIVSVNPSLEDSENYDNIFFVLDGNDKNIKNFSITNESRNSLGIFGYLNSRCIVKNVYFQDISITSTYSSALALGVFLKNEGTISDCGFLRINISATSNNTDDAFTPISGSNDFIIYSGIAAAVVDNEGTVTDENVLARTDEQAVYFQDATKYITISSSGNRPYVGGMIAQNRGYIYKTMTPKFVKVSAGENSNYVGGYVAANITPSSSSSKGVYYVSLELTTVATNGETIGVKGGNFTGAFCGNNTGRIQYCSVKGNNNVKKVVSATNCDVFMYGGKTYGGIAAANTGVITRCSSINIGAYYSSSTPNGIYGGIAGTSTYNISNCVSTGLVTANDTTIDIYAGGILGVGSTARDFSIRNCFTLVKLPKTTATLGSVVGVDGDTPYNNNKIQNCYYSSIVSFRPSPVSYGGTGASYGDLQYNISYDGLRSSSAGAKTYNLSDFTYSGWTGASISVVESNTSFINDPTESSYITGYSLSNGQVTVIPGSTGNVSQTVYYDTNITLPANIGPVDAEENLVLSAQPLALRIMLKSTAWEGSGTINDPFVLQSAQFIFLEQVPYGHYALSTSATTFNLSNSYINAPATFWGTLDGNGTTIACSATKAIFKGIYGSRNSANPQLDSGNHTSDPTQDIDANLKYGVVKNFTYNFNASNTSATSIFGDLCNATVTDVNFTNTNNYVFTPAEMNIGVVFKTVYGNSYLYNVYNDGIKATLENTNKNYISGFIGTVDAANAIIDNCGSNSVIIARTANIDYCSAFIGEIKSLSGAIQNCYSAGGVMYSTNGSLGTHNCLFAAKSVSSAHLYNCYYSPTNYYENNNNGVNKPIPDGSYTGSLSVWGFANSMYVIEKGQSGNVTTNPIVHLNRYVSDTYAGNPLDNSAYFTASFNSGASGYSVGRIGYSTSVYVTVNVAAGAGDSADLYLKHKATGLVARAGLASSSEIVLDDGYYLIQKPMDLYMICLNQATKATDNGRYLSSEYHFKLVANIDMTGFSINMWGKNTNYPFCGSLEGEVKGDGTPKYTISGLSMSSDGTCGLFGYVNGATITGIGIADSSFTGGTYTGALVGQIMTRANIANCMVSSSTVIGNARVGGLIGGIGTGAASSETIISQCFVDSTQVTANTSSSDYGIENPSICGGIIGCVGALGMSDETKYARIIRCSVSDSVISGNNYHVGGIVGLAACESNVLYGCTVSDSTVSSGYTSSATASVGGIAGAYGGTTLGGNSTYPNIVSSTTITGENASGIVSRLVNFVDTSTVSYCQVNGCEITGNGYAGGVTAHIGAFSSSRPFGNKVITECKIDSDTEISALVSGGVVGVVMSSYNEKVLTITNSYSYAKVITTGDKGSKIEGAGGFIGRLAAGLDTSEISVSNCISGGEIVGSASIGGVIGLLNSANHPSGTPIVSNCYITATLTQKSIKAYKGLIIGFVGQNNQSEIGDVVSNAVFSSFASGVSPYGNLVDSSATAATYTDVNMGADGTSGITVNAYSDTVRSNCFDSNDPSVNGEGTNCITLKQNIKGKVTGSPNAATRFTPGNLPTLSGFTFAKAKIVTGDTPTLYWESSNLTKLEVGVNQNYNNINISSNNIRVSLATNNFKGKVNVYTYYDGTVGSETVRFTIGFTCICSGIHKFDGFGSPDRPYKIYDAEDLIAIKEHHDSPLAGETGANFYTASYVLMNDIDLSDVCVDNGVSKSFPSIGNSTTPFKGSISSNGSNVYTISNLYENSTTIRTIGYAGNTGEHAEGGYSDCFGIFGYTEGATIANINFENATIIGGNSAGIIVGSAKDTDISNVTVSGDVSIEECITGGTLVGKSTGNVNIDTVSVIGTVSNSEKSISVTSQGSAGGILGVSIQSDGSSITNFVIRNCNIESLANTGTYYAGAVAAQMNGVVSGVYDEVDGNVTLTTAGVVDSCTVSAVICAGVVGGGSPNNGDNDYGLTIQGVNVTSTFITSRGTSNITTAGGILGRTLESYDYTIKDCNVADTCSCEAHYVVGGILGTANVSSSMYESSLNIYNCEANADLTQNVTNISILYGGNRKIAGVGGAIGLISQSATLRETDNSATIKVYDCTFRGQYSGSMNVGGILGEVSTQSIYSYRTTEPLLSNCIMLNTITKTVEETTHNRFGLVVGTIEGNVSSSTANPFPDNEDGYACNPFVNIFYSSYTCSSFDLFGESAFYTYQYIDMAEKIYDFNNISFSFHVISDGQTQSYELPIAMQEVDANDQLIGYLRLVSDEFHFNKEFYDSQDSTSRMYGKLTGDIINGFTVSGETLGDFEVASTEFEIASIESSNTTILSINENSNGTKSLIFHTDPLTHLPLNGMVDLIFNYTNGLRIAIPVICGVSYEGEGDVDSPILVSSAAIFAYVVPTLPQYYYKQTVDIDFSSSPYQVTRVIDNFSGHYDGDGHTLSNINLTVNKESNGGIFGTVSGTLTSNGDVLPNIENLTIENATITATGCTNVGVLAASVSNGASISNVTVDGCTLTTGNAPVGGIVGTIDGASKVENCTVNDTTLSATTGCVGGIAGIMNSGSGEINSCLVSDSVISSGNASALDIAGGIVAQAVGTVNGRKQVNNAGQSNEETVLLDSVCDCTVSAYYAGGAVGANEYWNTTSNLTINDVKVASSNTTVSGVTKHTAVTANYSATYDAPCAAGILAVAKGQNDHPADIVINNCYVSKHTVVSAQRNASGCWGTNINSYVNSVEITDTQSYATVSSTEKSPGQIVYAGGLISSTSINPDVIIMDGSVAGGNITATGWKSYAGGAVGYISGANATATQELFVNGVLSATVSSTKGSDQSQNPVNCYGKFLGGMENSTMFTDNSDFSEVVFHDNYYSSYPQDINFFGMNAVDSFNSITPQEEPFEDINVAQNFMISDSQYGTYNSIAIAKDLNEWKQFFVKFAAGKSSFTYGEDGKNTSYVDPEGFSVEGTDANGDPLFNIGSFQAIEDVSENITYYSFSVFPLAYGAGRVGAAYDCGLATSLPILCVLINGTGTENDPFQITDAVQLFVVGYILDSGYYFTQMNDIDLSNSYNQNGTEDEQIINYNGGKGFSPIGSESTPFQGNYDGQGYKIKGLYISRNNLDNIGLFGVVSSTSVNSPAVLKNIHVELLESDTQNTLTNGIIGRQNVGGLVGSIRGESSVAQVINCSVARSTVIGTNDVGALCGKVGAKVSITGSFTESDVYSVTSGSYAGGLVGNIGGGTSADTNVNKCFSSSNVYSVSEQTTDTIGKSGGIVGRISSGISYLSNCLFTGTTNSGHGVYGFKASTSNTAIYVSSVIDAGQNTSMTNGRFVSQNIPCIDSTSDSNLSNVYYDSALIKVRNQSTLDTMTHVTPLMTSEMVGTVTLDGITSNNWTFADKHYPVPNVDTTDAYSVTYASLLSAAMMTSESEEANSMTDALYGKGLVYPVQLPQYADLSDNTTKVTYASSIFDTSDQVAYPAGYDPNLYGVGNNKNTDLLFEDITDSQSSNYNMTSVYRNIFRQDTTGTKVLNLNGLNCLSNGEIMYNLQMPVIYASFTKSGTSYYREIKLPLSYESTYCISTQRQLFALGLASNENVQGTKFANFYGSDYNYKLITDITISPSNTTVFNPIGINDNGGYTGNFNGDGHTIANLTISVTGNTPAGMFSKLGNHASVSNLTLSNATVTGVDNVGTLVGQISGPNVTVTNCSATGSNGSVTATGSSVGGLIGSVGYASDVITSCSSTVNVSGVNGSIGGLIGLSNGTVTSCYATGDVSTSVLNNIGGIGGLIGHMERGSVTKSFASGAVTVEDCANITTPGKTYGVGGFVGIAEKHGDSGEGISLCFSTGNVTFGGNNVSGVITPAAGATATIGVGGFCGVNSTPITNCYSSAYITSKILELRNLYISSTYIVGIGGVCGVVLDDVQNVYSSGSATRPTIMTYTSGTGTEFYGVGGVVGTRKGDTDVSVSNAVFDKQANGDSTMTAIGDESDNNINNFRAFTTEEMTDGNNNIRFDDAIWGFDRSAYPYLKELLNEDVSDAVKANSILSVVSFNYNEEDYSGIRGDGITMAITVPVQFVYQPNTPDEVTYNLDWAGSTLNGNQATPVRTRNTTEEITLTATVRGLEQYGSRERKVKCADMRGTYNQPYLIGSVTDWEHVNMTPAEQQAAVASSPLLYGQWATPLDDQNQQTEGRVYYQLMSDIDVSTSSRVISDNSNSTYTYVISYTDGESVQHNETRTFDFSGFVINGNSYSVQNASSTGPYFTVLEADSALAGISFKDIAISAGNNTALVGVNNGHIYDVSVTGTVAAGTGFTAGIAAVNNNEIDGCISDVTISGASSNVGGLVGQNNSGATVSKSCSAGTLNVSASAPSTIGSLVASNAGNISDSFSMVDMQLAGGSIASSIGAFIGTSTAGTIQGCYTRSNLNFTANPSATSTVALLAGTLLGGTVKDCYAAGYLGAYLDAQHSILFAQKSNSASVSAVYVDKSIAGTPSYKSYDYSIVTHRLINMTLVDSSMGRYFTADNAAGTTTPYTHYPQITSILNAQNVNILDIPDETDGNVDIVALRNFDLIREYAKVANVTLKTVNSFYLDKLPTNSSNRSTNPSINPTISDYETVRITLSPTNIADISSGVISTTATAGTTIITASKPVTLRSVTFTPAIKFKLKTVSTLSGANPNFGNGLGAQGNSYKINNAESLQSLIYYGQHENLYFALNDNIDCNGYAFKQIPALYGTLCYNVAQASRRVIYNLDLTQGALFNTVCQGAYIGNMGIVGATLNAPQRNNAAILAEHVTGATIRNIVVSGEVIGGDNSGIIAGSVSNNSTINSVITSGYVKGKDVVGGVVGSLDTTTMYDVLSTTYVDGTSDVGGIAGHIVNSSNVDDIIFGGSSTGCSITALSRNSTLTDYYADYQFNISQHTVGELNETNILKSSQKLSTVFSDSITGFVEVSGRYIVPSVFNYSVTSDNAAHYYLAVDFASRYANIRSGAGMGTIGKYMSITFPKSVTTGATSQTMTVSGTEVQYGSNPRSDYLNIDTTSLTDYVKINVANFDENVTSTAVKLYANSAYNNIFKKTKNRIFRYFTPGMVRTVNVSYTLTDSTGDLANRSVGILFRSLSDASGARSESMSVFDKVGTSPESVDAILIAANSSNGFYIDSMLPDGYEYSITATDANNTPLTVSQSSTQPGMFVDLSTTSNNNITVSISIVESSSTPWGVRDKHTTLQ